MYAAGSAFLAHINNPDNIERLPKSKIIVGGVTYTGETHLKTAPKIEHKATSMIGGFPSKTCDFEIWRRDSNLNLRGKEVTAYRGLEINGSITWIPIGIFSAAQDEDLKNSDTGNFIIFHGTDRSSKFDIEYTGSLTYPRTLRSFVQDVCAKCGVTLATTTFPLYNQSLAQPPNIPQGTSCRELISQAAELGGCIAQINRSGELQISRPYNTGVVIPKRKYRALALEAAHPPITAVSLGHAGYDDDVIYPANAGSASSWWKLSDNPFVDLNRQAWVSVVYNQLRNMTIIPFELSDFVDDFIFDLNDMVLIEDKSGARVQTTILQLKTQNRIRSAFRAEPQNNGMVNHSIAGSVRDGVRRAQLQVDHVNGKIETLVEQVSTNSNTIQSQFIQTAEQFEFLFRQIDGNQNLLEEYIRFQGALMELGKRGNDIVARLTNDRLSFLENGTEVAYISNAMLYITDARIIGYLHIGEFAWISRANGNISLVHIGG